MPDRHRSLTLTLGLAVLLAFLLRLTGLTAQSLWYDEGFSVHLASQSWGQILTGELNLPPLYHVLLGVWIRIVGRSEFVVRYLSVCAGLLIVALGGAFGTLTLGRRAGALTALMLAVSPIEIWYAQETRMYAMLGALSLGSSVVLLRLMRGEERRGLWLAYMLANMAAVYTHYYAALVVAAQGVWVVARLLAARDARLLRHWALAQIGLGAALVPWLPVFWAQWQAAQTTYWPGRLGLDFVARETALGVVGGSLTIAASAARPLALGTAGLAGLGLVAGLTERRTRWGTALLAIYCLIPFALFFWLIHTRPKFSPRYLLPVVPGVLALAAGGVVTLWPRKAERWHHWLRLGLAFAVGGGLTILSTYSATNALRDPAYGRDDLRGAARFLARAVAADEAIILLSGHMEPAFTYYYPGRNCYPIPARYTPSPSVDDIVTPDVLEDLNRIMEGRRGVWLLLWQDEVVDPNGVVLTLLDLSTTQVPVAASFRGLELRHYTFPPGTRLHRETWGSLPLNVTVGQGDLALIRCDLPTAPTPSGGVATLVFYWQALRPISHDYRVSLRVVDELNQERARHDGRLASYMYPTDRWRPGVLVMGRHEISLPPGLPPGTYAIEARIYRAGNGAAQVIPVGQFEVGRALQQPDLADLGIPHAFVASFGELQLVGYDISPREGSPGQPVYLTLFWRAVLRPTQRYRVALFLGGRPWETLPLPASVTGMEPGDIFRVQYPLRVARDAPDGSWQLLLRLQSEGGRLSTDEVALTQFVVHDGTRVFQVPATIQNPMRMNLGDKVTFLGYDIESGSIRPGEVLHLTLYWQAVQAMDVSYTVFTHVLDSQEKIWGQVDSIPRRQARPTNGWLPGEVLVDPYDVLVKADAPPGQYLIEIGMYDGATGARLPVRRPTSKSIE